MSETLLIRLASKASQPVHWWLFSASDRLLFSGQLPNAAALASLQKYTPGSQVIALVPACDLILRPVKLPARLTRKTRKALPFLLEDEVAEETAQLHIAVLAHEATLVHLAAVEHSVMQAWLSWLHDAGLQASRMLPDVFALPEMAAGCRWKLGEQHLMRQSRWQGMVLEEELIACLPVEKAEPWQNPAQPLPLRAAHLPAATLLQGVYQPRSKKTARPGVWRAPIGLLAAGLVIGLTIQGLEALSLKQQQTRLHKQMSSLYHQLYPGNRPVSDPWRAFNQRMDDQKVHFLPLAQALDSLLAAPLQVQSLRYAAAEQQLQAQLSGASAVALQAMEQRLPAGFSLRIAEKNGISGIATVYLGRKSPRQKESLPAMSDVEKMKWPLAAMQAVAAQQSAAPAQESNIAAVIASSREKAHLPPVPIVQKGQTLELNYASPQRFSALVNWLQTLEFQHGIVTQLVELTDKGQGNVAVERLVLSGKRL